MHGIDHYREAERLLCEADEVLGEAVPLLISAAQVHATLALASVGLGLHLPAFRPVPDSPLKGRNEGPNQ
jgi:hypothetical protein